MLDEIFGSSNRVANVIWQHSVQPKGYLSGFSIHHNEVLIYQKSSEFELAPLPRTAEDNKAYSNPDAILMAHGVLAMLGMLSIDLILSTILFLRQGKSSNLALMVGVGVRRLFRRK